MTEAQYNSAIAIYHPTAGRKTGKVYDVKSTGSDLTVTGGGGTRINKAGVVEVVPANMAKIDYSTGSPAFLIEPARTNYVAQSMSLSDWTLRASTVRTLNQVGITGAPNTAILLEDNMTTDYGQVSNLTFFNGMLKFSVWIKKDTNQSRFPELFFRFRRASDSQNQDTILQLNTQTGATAIRAGATANPYYVIDRGNWWEVVAVSLATSDRQELTIRPAMGTTIGTYTDPTTGSIIVGHVGIYNSSVVNETPIITNGSAVTRTALEISSAVAPGVSAIDIVLNGVSSTITTIPATLSFPEGKVSSVIVR